MLNPRAWALTRQLRSLEQIQDAVERHGTVARRACGPYVAPATDEDRRVAELWRKVLKLETVGMRDDFFELGGNSLQGVQLLAEVRRAFGKELRLLDLFEASVLQDFAHRLLGAGPALGDVGDIPRASRDGSLPLSYPQQRAWFLHRFENGEASDNIPLALRLRGELDLRALQHAAHEIVQRHETLRTVFAAKDGIPRQVIQPASDARIVEEVLPAHEAHLDHLHDRIRTEAAKPFDLERGPLLRIRVIRLSATEAVLLVVLHHIVADGWSVGVLVDELAQLYAARTRGQPAALPPLPIQYVDHAVWQRQQLADGRLQEQIAFWKETLRGAPALLELPTDRPRPPIASIAGDRVEVALDAEVTAGLKRLAHDAGATLYMVLLGAVDVLLHRITGETDLSVGTPVAGRGRPELRNLIGFFVNTLVLRNRLDPASAFVDFVRTVKAGALDAFSHADLPFERVMEEVNPSRSLSFSPLFQIMFILQNTPPGRLTAPGLVLEPLSIQAGSSKFDLTFEVRESGKGLSLSIEYSTALFERDTIVRLARCFQTLLAGVCADARTPIRELPLVPQEDRLRMLEDWNSTDRLLPRLGRMHQAFEAVAERQPEAVAVVCGEARTTYAQLDARATQLAGRLRGLGVGHGALVAIGLDRSMEMVAALLAVHKAGGAYVPLDPAYPEERLAYMLEDAGPAVLVTQERLRAAWPPFHTVLCVDGPDEASESRAAPARPAAAEIPADLAYVIYTSGSTGKPKGVMVRHAGLSNFLSAMAEETRLSTDDAWLAVTSLSFDIAALELFLPLMCGARIVLASREDTADGEALCRLMADHAVTVLQATPATWYLLQASRRGIAGALRLALCGGEAWQDSLLTYLCTCAARVLNVYGPTETTVWSTACELRQGDAITLGRPIANTTAYVLDAALQPVPIGVWGELYLGGAGVAHGYLNRPDLSAERFLDNPFSAGRLYRTGDVVRYLRDGRIEYRGRSDNQVKVRGYRVELAEVEAVLLQHPNIVQAAVVTGGENPQEQRLVAFVTPSQAPGDALRAALHRQLPAYMIPDAILGLESLPLLPNGKIDGHRLRTLAQTASVPRSADREEPTSELEKKVCAIAGRLLKRQDVGPNENFFELGGHSLQAVRLVTALGDEFGVEISLKELFTDPTLRHLVQVLEERLLLKDLLDQPLPVGPVETLEF